MTNSSPPLPPEPPSNSQKPLGIEEWIGILVALATMSIIFFWVTGRKESGLNQIATSGFSRPMELNRTQTVEELPTQEPSFSDTTTSDEVASEPADASKATAEKMAVAEEDFSGETGDKLHRKKTIDIRKRKNLQYLPDNSAIPGAVGMTAWILADNSRSNATDMAANAGANGESDLPEAVKSSRSPEAVADSPKVSTDSTDSSATAPETQTPADSPKVATDSIDGTDATKTASPEKAVPASTPTAAKESSGKSIEFSDVGDKHWAKEFIYKLAAANFISGFPDRSFKPERAMKRAEFAAQLNGVFGRQPEDKEIQYKDVADDYWAKYAIELATKVGAMNGYPEGDFRPDNPMPRVEVLAALVTGLNLTIPPNVEEVLEIYQDKDEIPDWAREKIAAATASGLVVNYPEQNFLNPNEAASRADVAVMVYQALVWRGRLDRLPSEYVVTLE